MTRPLPATLHTLGGTRGLSVCRHEADRILYLQALTGSCLDQVIENVLRHEV